MLFTIKQSYDIVVKVSIYYVVNDESGCIMIVEIVTGVLTTAEFDLEEILIH